MQAHPNGKIVRYDKYPEFEEHAFVYNPQCKDIYGDCNKEIPEVMPEPKGKPIKITDFVDAIHAQDLVTRRNVTGLFVLMNNTPIRWVCKRQKTVEISTYCSEISAARMATETIIELRYHLRMIGVPIDDSFMLLGDNMSIILNTTLPSSMLKKKANAISYHKIRESVVCKILKFGFIKSTRNISDIFTKALDKSLYFPLVEPYLFQKPKHITILKEAKKE